MRFDAAQAHQLLMRNAQLITERTEMLFHQTAVKAVVAGGHGRVRGEDSVLCDFANGVVKRHAVFFHPFADSLECGKSAVTFVQVVHTRRDAHGAERLDAADAEDQLLANAGAMITAIKSAGKLAIFGTALFDIAIEQVQIDAADLNVPDLGKQRTGSCIDADFEFLAIFVERRFHRHVFDFVLGVFLVLIPIEVEMLTEVPLLVKEPDRNQRNPEALALLIWSPERTPRPPE